MEEMEAKVDMDIMETEETMRMETTLTSKTSRNTPVLYLATIKLRMEVLVIVPTSLRIQSQ